MAVFTPGFSEAVWCTVNANFLSQVIALGVSVALLQTMWTRLNKLTGPDYQNPVRPQTPADAVSYDDAVKDAKAKRRRRSLTYVAAIITLLCSVGAIWAWVRINIMVGGNTKCADLAGKFTGAAPNWAFAFVLLLILAAIGRAFFALAAKGLPEKSK